MLDYMECPIEDFHKAMKVICTTPYSEIPTDLLYIAFTKYRSDYDWVSYTRSDIQWKIKRVRDSLGEELEARGIKIMY